MTSVESPADSCPKMPQPGELWSLWDLMKKLSLHDLVGAGEAIRYARDRYFDPDDEQKERRKHVQTAITRMKEISDQFSLQSLRLFMEQNQESPPETVEAFDMMNRAFFTALEAQSVYLVPPERQKFLLTNVFSSVIFAKFDAARRDFAEARRCLGFGRPTASVFHMMRSMEVVVGELAAAIGVTNIEKEWGKLLADFDAKIKDMPKSEEKKKWSEARSNLWHVKEAWRNPTMHPRQLYSQHEAEEIYAAVHQFVKHLGGLIEALSSGAPSQ